MIIVIVIYPPQYNDHHVPQVDLNLAIGVVGGVVALLILAIVITICWRREQNSERNQG